MMENDPTYLRQMCVTIGISPPAKVREPNDEELALVKQWLRLKTRAFCEQAHAEPPYADTTP